LKLINEILSRSISIIITIWLNSYILAIIKPSLQFLGRRVKIDGQQTQQKRQDPQFRLGERAHGVHVDNDCFQEYKLDLK